jgi:hypothetical protein
VDEAHDRERERPVGHQLHLQRERDHVRVGRRQLVAHAEAAHVVVVGEVVAVDLDVVHRELEVGQLRVPAAAQAGQLARQLGDGSGQRARVERAQRGR